MMITQNFRMQLPSEMYVTAASSAGVSTPIVLLREFGGQVRIAYSPISEAIPMGKASTLRHLTVHVDSANKYWGGRASASHFVA